MHVGMCDCMRSESESELGNQLYTQKRKKQTCMPVCLCVYIRIFAGKKKYTHTSNTKNTGKYMPSNDGKSKLSLKQKYLSTQPRETRTLTEAMKAR